jgi:hypothetical protein
MVRRQLSDYEGGITFFSFLFRARARRKMMASLNGQERTTTNLRNLLDQAGWKLIAVHYDIGKDPKAIAVPI